MSWFSKSSILAQLCPSTQHTPISGLLTDTRGGGWKGPLSAVWLEIPNSANTLGLSFASSTWLTALSDR